MKLKMHEFTSTIAATMALFAIGTSCADAQELIQNKWKSTYLALERGQLVDGQNPDAPGAQWEIISAGSSGAVYLRSVATGGYLQAPGGVLKVDEVGQDPSAAAWFFDKVDAGHMRLQNFADRTLHVNNENGPPIAGPVEPGWWSAMWRVQAVQDGIAVNEASAGQARQQGSYQQSSGGQQGNTRQSSTQDAYQDRASNANQSSGASQGSYESTTTQSQSASQNGTAGTGAASNGGSAGQIRQGDVALYFQNRSNKPLDVFVNDSSGTPTFVFTVNPGYQVVQGSPVGRVWRVAQDNEWKGGFVVNEDPEQLIRFP